MKKISARMGAGLLLLAGIAIGAYVTNHGLPLVSNAQAEEGVAEMDAPLVSPTKARARDAYYPNSEDLKPDEMRVIACGTGMPTTRSAQAAACFLVELGNGDKFIFDIGSGAAERISALQIP